MTLFKLLSITNYILSNKVKTATICFNMEVCIQRVRTSPVLESKRRQRDPSELTSSV